MSNPFAALAQPLVCRPGDAIPSQTHAGRWKAAASARRRFQPVPNPWGLTGAEWSVLNALTDTGLCNVDAADKLCMSPKTLGTHLHRAKDKMSAASAMHAILIFDRWRRAGKPQPVEVVLRFGDGAPTVEMRMPEAA